VKDGLNGEYNSVEEAIEEVTGEINFLREFVFS